MCIVAQATVLLDRRMLPKERTALFGVAVVTKLIDGVSRKQIVSHRLVGIVATGAGHFALSHRVYRWFETGCPLFLVAGITDVRLLMRE